MLNIFLGKTNTSKYIAFICLFLCISLPYFNTEIKAEDNPKIETIFNTIGRDFKSAYFDGKYILNQAITPSIEHILYPTIAISSTYIASNFDEKMRYPASARYDDKIMRIPGELYTAAILPTTIYLSGLVFEDEQIRTTGRLLFESMLLSGATNITLKYIIGRARPYNDLGNSHFEYFEMRDSFQSLPSGHSTLAFTSAALIAARIDKWWAYIGLYSIATSTAYQRIRSDKHWFSDTVLGAGIGIFSAYTILNAYESNKADKSETQTNKLTFYPQNNHLGMGIGMSYCF